MARDPKIDPQPGDMLTAMNGRTRTVIRRQKNDVWYTNGTSIKERKSWLNEWLEWCQQQVL